MKIFGKFLTKSIRSNEIEISGFDRDELFQNINHLAVLYHYFVHISYVPYVYGINI